MSSVPAIPKQVPVAIPDEMWEDAGQLPCVLCVDVPLRKFTVRDLLRLTPGALLESQSSQGSDVPASVNSQLVAWAEFEVVGKRLAIRVTELS
jgi:flagellar motor switch protein FliN/FliY